MTGTSLPADLFGIDLEDEGLDCVWAFGTGKERIPESELSVRLRLLASPRGGSCSPAETANGVVMNRPAVL